MRKRRRELKQELPQVEVSCQFDPFFTDLRFRVIRFHVKEGDAVSKGDLLCSTSKLLDESAEEEEDDLTTNSATPPLIPDVGHSPHVSSVFSPHDGTVAKLLVEEDEVFQADSQPLLKLNYCLHNVVLESGLCTLCGRTVKKQTTNAELVINVEGGVKLNVSKSEAMQVRTSTVTRLFTMKKLSLVLDLDHTLIHCTDDVRAQSFLKKSPFVYSFQLDGKQMYLKPRPGLFHFLTRMRESCYEMHVYTAGTRPYAIQVCKIIDPMGHFFGDRIISRDDNPELSAQEKRISRLFPVDDTMVVIVDDRREVWQSDGSDRNLLTCSAYYYFLGMHEVNNSSDAGVNDPQVEKTSDVGLAKVEEVLTELHREFYSSDNTLEKQLNGDGNDVKEILRRLRLGVFNRPGKREIVIALDPEMDPPERLPHLAQLAKACGATVQDCVDEKVTHLISSGNTKLCWFARNLPNSAIWVVSPQWLERCAHYWRHVREDTFSFYKTKSAFDAV